MLEAILEHYKEELRDVADYINMAKSAQTDLQRQILKDIAKEEHEHAEALKHLLEKAGAYNQSDEMKELEKTAKNELEAV